MMVSIWCWPLAFEISYEVITLDGTALHKPLPDFSKNCTGPTYCEYKLPSAVDVVLMILLE